MSFDLVLGWELLPSSYLDAGKMMGEIQQANPSNPVRFIKGSTHEGIIITYDNEVSPEDTLISTEVAKAHLYGYKTNDFKFDSFGNQLTVDAGKSGIKETYISANLCDKTTWYQASIRVEDEVMVDSGNHILYNMTIPKIVIDVTHWKISDERTKAEIIACKPIVRVDDITYIENYYIGTTLQTPVNGYTIDYLTGSITFNNVVEGVVTMSYNTLPETGASVWEVKAPEGHRVLLNKAEIQFSEDVSMTDAVRFVPCSTIGLDKALDPLKAQYNLPDGYVVELPTLDPSWEKRFDTKYQIIDDADGYYFVPETPLAYRGIRDLGIGLHIYRWNYEGNENMELNSKLGRFIKIFLEHDIPLGGTRVTATLYGSKSLL